MTDTPTLARLPRTTRPICPTCGRDHGQLLSTDGAAKHCRMGPWRFRKAVADGIGPTPWKFDLYAHPRYHVAELDAWLGATKREVAAA